MWSKRTQDTSDTAALEHIYGEESIYIYPQTGVGGVGSPEGSALPTSRQQLQPQISFPSLLLEEDIELTLPCHFIRTSETNLTLVWFPDNN